ncbi:MAG: laccase domain-containing protein [Verrucomicrobiota bacterium]
MELLFFLKRLRELGVSVDFVPRVPEVAGSLDKAEGLRELEPWHRKAVEDLGFAWSQMWTAEQVHGGEVALVGEGAARMVAGVDGLVTRERGVLLGIYVADCGLIWLVDRKTGALGLLHSGKKGTEANILGAGVEAMQRHFGSEPGDILGVLGPCIRPPHYEVNFAGKVEEQAREAGLGEFVDCGLCTGADLDSFYSYLQARGETGRMLGLLGWRSSVSEGG